MFGFMLFTASTLAGAMEILNEYLREVGPGIVLDVHVEYVEKDPEAGVTRLLVKFQTN